jgi:hypothetical protein
VAVAALVAVAVSGCCAAAAGWHPGRAGTERPAVVCDLLAVCLEAAARGRCARRGGHALPGPLGPELATVAGLYRLGAAPRRAWADVPVELAVLGRVLVRAGESGSTVVPALRSLAADARAEQRSRADAAVRRAGVWVLAPLGACSCRPSSAWVWCRWCSASRPTSSADPRTAVHSGGRRPQIRPRLWPARSRHEGRGRGPGGGPDTEEAP